MKSRLGSGFSGARRLGARLVRDTRGSTLMMLAAGVIPVMAAIGGGVDLTRAYMAQARLQQAVDAAALAGRKAMDGTDASTAEGAVDKFIGYNFPDRLYDSAPVQRTIETTQDGSLIVKASTSVPTTLMRAFGIDDIDIAAQASARRAGTNIDVVLVLDVTGSMAYDVNGGTGTPRKIDALKAATLSFLEQLDSTRTQLEASNLRVRVGIIPYSQTVNIGRHLRAENPNYVALTGLQGVTQISTSAVKNSATSNKWSNKLATTSSGPYYGWQMLSGLNVTNFVNAGGTVGSAYTNAYAWKGCVEMRQTVTSISASSDKATIPTGAWDIIDVAPGANVGGQIAPPWRPYLALPQWDSNRYGPPSASQQPWSQIRYPVKNNTATSAQNEAPAVNPTSSSNGDDPGPNAYCPAEAKALSNEAQQTKAQLASYVNGLKPVGSTLHDVGMFWGLAMISPGLPFPNVVPERGVRRYIIFMTDGAMDPNEATYSAYGVDDHEDRTKTGTGDTTAQHNKRFEMLCERAKRGFPGEESTGGGSVNISTIAFGTAVTTQLRNCATTPEQAYLASSASELNKIFKQIAQNIGYLRLSQ